jgi:hypothetical protein
MKFRAFQRSQGEVQQNVKPRSPRSTSDHVDPVDRSPCQVGPAGRPDGPIPKLKFLNRFKFELSMNFKGVQTL